jgi:hypothetical protein
MNYNRPVARLLGEKIPLHSRSEKKESAREEVNIFMNDPKQLHT